MRATFRAHFASGSPWLALGSVWLLFEIPTALRSFPPEPSALEPTFEALVLLSLWGAAQVWSSSKALRISLWLLTALAVFLRVDQMVCLLLMREESLLYDQWFMLRHLAVLVNDLMSLSSLLVAAIVAMVVFAVTKLVKALLRHARGLFAPDQRRRTAKILALVWAVSAVMLLASAWAPAVPMRSLAAALSRNVRASIAMYRSLERDLARSPYQQVRQLTLREKPDVLLFIVESYGRLLFSHADARTVQARALGQMGDALARTGWHAVSAFSEAPVSGGRSWIAEASMVLGMSIRHQSQFQHIMEQRPLPPNLVGFLNAQGYETVLLAPADRDRPGAHIVNRYGFTRLLSYDSLDYQGPPFGWGIVPDQYSLEVAARKVLDRPGRPVFLDFHMVSSHAPWKDVPALLAPGERLQANGPAHQDPRTISTVRLLKRQGERYARSDPWGFLYMGNLSRDLLERYHAAIRYDLEVITRYLAQRERDAIVVILGDHQPPLISPYADSFDTPVHVLSRDPRRLCPLKKLGFQAGLMPQGRSALAHAGLFSLLVHALETPGCSPQAPRAPVLLRGS